MDNDKIKEFMDAKVSVTSVEDGWVFQFDEDTLALLHQQATLSESGKVVLFVKSPQRRGN